MDEKVSYAEFFADKKKDFSYEPRKKRSGFGLITVVGVGVLGYFLGYKKARNTAKTILDVIFEKCPDKKEAFSKAWNIAVDEYFDKK